MTHPRGMAGALYILLVTHELEFVIYLGPFHVRENVFLDGLMLLNGQKGALVSSCTCPGVAEAPRYNFFFDPFF